MAMRGMNIFTSPETSERRSSEGGAGSAAAGEGSILNEVLDEWNISMKFKQLDLEMKNLIEKHSWNAEGAREIDYDDVRRRHRLLPKNPRKELKDMLRRFEEEERNGFGLGMSCPVRSAEPRRQSEREKERESEHRIEAIFEKYGVRDFSGGDASAGDSPALECDESDLRERKETPARRGAPMGRFGPRSPSASARQEVDSPEKRDLDAMHSHVDMIVHQCLRSRGADVEAAESQAEASQRGAGLENILGELEAEERESNFLDVRESINKIRLGQSDLFPKAKALSPIAKKRVA